MGQVYRARDLRLRRDVAIKVLHHHLAEPDHIQRLNREARTTGALNHPNIVAVFDLGMHDGAPYVVSELLEGESLRDRLARGPLPYRKALEYAAHIADALAAAHARAIFHRDVKPGNVFITGDGRVKLLDFGLAKRRRVEVVGPDDSTDSRISAAEAGVGTAGYMAPEQVVGDAVDHRTDLFALGIVLYEMLTGQRPWKRASAIETMNAILNDDAADLRLIAPELPPPAVAVVRRCLEKNPEERFQSARDLAFQLRQLESADRGGSLAPGHRVARGLRLRRVVMIAALGAAAAAAAWLVRPGGSGRDAPAVTFQQVTFQRGRIVGARFAPPGIVYSQARAGKPLDVWLVQGDGPDELALGHQEAGVLSARAGKLALLLDRRFAGGDRVVGTLAVSALGGGAPRRLADDVEDADWDPRGEEIAIARSRGQGAPSRLEYPVGRVLYTSPGSIQYPRVSTDGRRVAFLEDRGGSGDGGRVVVVDRDGRVQVLTPDWISARGMAWSPDGRDIWYTAGNDKYGRSVRSVDQSGRERVLYEAPGVLTLWDVDSDGRVLLARDDTRKSVMGRPPGGAREIDLSWHDAAGLGRLSRDGKTLLFGDRFGVYMRPTDGAPAMKLGLEGAWADDLSPDGQFVLATTARGDQLILVPTGPGAPQLLPNYQIKAHNGATWFPDGRRILVNGNEERGDIRSYVLELGVARPPRPLTGEGVWALALSGDGALAAAIGSGRISLWPTDGGPPRDVPGTEPDDRPAAFTSDDRALWVFRRGEMPAHIHRVDVKTGERVVWKTISPPDPAGVYSLIDFEITRDGRAYAYTYRRVLSQLYVARGLR
jgi:hypothetical protein